MVRKCVEKTFCKTTFIRSAFLLEKLTGKAAGKLGHAENDVERMTKIG